MLLLFWMGIKSPNLSEHVSLHLPVSLMAEISLHFMEKKFSADFPSDLLYVAHIEFLLRQENFVTA
jgi:hypothetical protein